MWYCATRARPGLRTGRRGADERRQTPLAHAAQPPDGQRRQPVNQSQKTRIHGTEQNPDFAARKRLPRTQAGRSVHARDAGFVQPEGGDALFGHDGHHYGRRLLGRRGIPRPQGRTGLRSGHPHRHHRRGHGVGAGQEEHAGTERHHPVDRRLVGRDRRRSDLHPPGTLHPGARRRLLSGIPLVAVRRTAGHRPADPLPQILRQGDARQIPLPRGHGDHRSPRLGREGRLAGQTAGRGGTRRADCTTSSSARSACGPSRSRRASANGALSPPTSSRWSSG